MERPLDLLEQKIMALLERFAKLQDEHRQTLEALAAAHEKIKALEKERELISNKIQDLLKKFEDL